VTARNKFIAWYYDEFHFDPLFKRMNETVEATPWHREKSVGTHTDMVVSEYIAWADKNWTIETLIGSLAAAFHDTGKPSARVEKFSEKRGKYNSFGGHEIISARLWEDYAIRNSECIWKLFGIRDINLIYKISFVIEHHMPYEVPADKIRDIAITAGKLFIEPIFQNHLTADTHGRLADDHETKIAAVDAWIVEFEKQMIPTNTYEKPVQAPYLYIPIAPSGAGKSTYFKKLKKADSELIFYSWDDLRLQWYNATDYQDAYNKSTEDNQFGSKVMKEYSAHLKTRKSIYVDNTNLSRRRRRPYIDDARKAGYYVIGIIFPIALDTVLKRQLTRMDKNVPESAVRQHYMSLQCPLYREFDRIEVINTICQ
jgi:predicted kinase